MMVKDLGQKAVVRPILLFVLLQLQLGHCPSPHTLDTGTGTAGWRHTMHGRPSLW